MRVVLVNAPGTEQAGFSGPPLGLLCLAGALRQSGIDVDVVDGCLLGWAGLRRRFQDARPDIVGVTCLTPARHQSLAAAALAKQILPMATVILGGVHPTLMYKQMLENYSYIDAIVLGEGEESLLEIAQGRPFNEILGIAYRSDGRVVKTANRPYIHDLDTIAFPAWDLADLRQYPARCPDGLPEFRGIDLTREPRVQVIFSRGCSGHCSFCSTWRFWRGYRQRSPKNMADELEWLYKDFGVRHFCFADDALTIDQQAADELCDEIIRRGLKIAFYATTRADSVTPELLAKLHMAGCYEISFGIESGSQRMLESMYKDSDVETAEKAIRMTNEAGIRSCALLIAGSVGETNETINETIDLVQRSNPTSIGMVGGLWIMPGTALFNLAKKKGIIDDDFWLGPEPYMVYTAEHSRTKIGAWVRAVNNRRKLDGSSMRRLYVEAWLWQMKMSLAHLGHRLLDSITIRVLSLRGKPATPDRPS